MTEFERQLVKAFNWRFKGDNTPEGLAYRQKQHRFSSQLCDIMIDSGDDDYYLAVENKKLKTQSEKKLYFSQHFSVSNEGHQAERMQEFIEKSGRTGFLAVELRRGVGKPRKAYMIPWEDVYNKYDNDESGLSLKEIKEYCEIPRDSSQYTISDSVAEFIKDNQ